MELRKNLPQPIPARIRNLPVSDKGYPVPFFVSKVDGVWDFRVIDPDRMLACVNRHLCWVCGQQLGRHLAFVLGPMCAVNRTSAEPPLHLECAEWSAKACPFLTLPKAVRREAGMPEQKAPPAGIMLERNPGVALVWVTEKYRMFRDGSGGVLFNVGEPLRTLWFAEGRDATRDEIIASINSGLPFLLNVAKEDDEHNGNEVATEQLQRCVDVVMRMLPA